MLRKISDLSEFLHYPNRTPYDVSRFLAQRTFDNFESLGVFIAQIEDNSALRHIGSFGYPQKIYEKWERFPLLMDIPLSLAVRTGSVVFSLSSANFESRFKDIVGGIDFDEINPGWKTCVSWPIITEGGILAFFHNEIPKTPEHEAYFYAIGSLVGLWLSKNSSRMQLPSVPNNQSRSTKGDELTARQEAIVQLLRTGVTNREIALHLGYSESLIRKECISIFRLLGISSRNDLLFDREA
jgi:DNA-binding CsgD family transcriptional regulator